MPITINNPAPNTQFSTTEVIAVSGIGGPATALACTTAPNVTTQLNAGLGSNWSGTVGPIAQTGNQTIQVTGADSSTATVGVEIV